MPAPPAGGCRPVSVPLMVGLVVLPGLCVWLLLRRGYAPSTCRAAFVSTFTLPVLMIIAQIAATLRR